MDMNNINLATYGTLRLGQGNHSFHLKDSPHIGTFQVKGFKLWTNGAFPYATPTTEDSEITVDVFRINPQTLRGTDCLEGYPRGYDRKKIRIDNIMAWIYYQEEERLGKWAKPVKSGDWMDEVKKERNFYNWGDE